GETIAFMHAVQEGAASKSYGLAVAALAGVPREVIARARQKLGELENTSIDMPAAHSGTDVPVITDSHSNTSTSSITKQTENTAQLSLLSETEPPVITALAAINPDNLTAKQALDLLYKLKAL
ncbi:MAG: MutS-related protein, partial [Plesiomonas sp.]